MPDSAVLRYLFDGQVEAAHPVLVLHDGDAVTALFEPSLSVSRHSDRPRVGPRSRNLERGALHTGFVDRVWDGDGVLRVHADGQPWSTWRWLEDGRWSQRWYVNLEEPWVRSATGFDSEDWILDIVIERGAWSLKDEDEFAWAEQTGRFDPAMVERIRTAAAAALGVIDARGWPFDADWSAWLPAAGVAPVALLDGWDRLA